MLKLPKLYEEVHERLNMADCRHVKIIQSREQLAALPPGPKAVLATLPTLEAGASRDLLVDWASDPHSLIILTERPQVRFRSSGSYCMLIWTLADLHSTEMNSAAESVLRPCEASILFLRWYYMHLSADTNITKEWVA